MVVNITKEIFSWLFDDEKEASSSSIQHYYEAPSEIDLQEKLNRDRTGLEELKKLKNKKKRVSKEIDNTYRDARRLRSQARALDKLEYKMEESKKGWAYRRRRIGLAVKRFLKLIGLLFLPYSQKGPYISLMDRINLWFGFSVIMIEHWKDSDAHKEKVLEKVKEDAVNKRQMLYSKANNRAAEARRLEKKKRKIKKKRKKLKERL